MKSYLQNMGAIFAQSFTKEVLFAILLAFVAVMITVGAQGQTGLAVKALEAIYVADDVGQSILMDGVTFESLRAQGLVDDALLQDFQFFLVKAVIALFVFITFIYSVLVLTETAIWNMFAGKISLKSFWLRFRLNFVLFFVAIIQAIITLVLYVGFQYFRVIAILDIPIFILGNLIRIIGFSLIIHMFFATNLMALKKKSVRSILREYLKFSFKGVSTIVSLYAAALLLLLLLATIGMQINMMFPSAFGLLAVLSLIIPLVWLRQLLYVNWARKNTKN